MISEFSCICGQSKEAEYPFGKSAKTIKCKCGKRMTRDISIPRYRLLGDGWAGKSRM